MAFVIPSVCEECEASPPTLCCPRCYDTFLCAACDITVHTARGELHHLRTPVDVAVPEVVGVIAADPVRSTRVQQHKLAHAVHVPAADLPAQFGFIKGGAQKINYFLYRAQGVPHGLLGASISESPSRNLDALGIVTSVC